MKDIVIEQNSEFDPQVKPS